MIVVYLARHHRTPTKSAFDLHPLPTNMTIISNDPTLWPTINVTRSFSYFTVAAFVGAAYDWALTVGQEVELVWRQRRALMAVLYVGTRYLGMLCVVLEIVDSVPTISVTDTGCWTIYILRNWMGFLVFTMLSAIIITRSHAMYQRSRKILTFLIVSFLAVNIFDGFVAVFITMHASGEEYVLSSTYQCSISFPGEGPRLDSITWILGTVWEVLTLCLAVWIAVKHFLEL
jgi:hypothetical protein